MIFPNIEGNRLFGEGLACMAGMQHALLRWVRRSIRLQLSKLILLLPIGFARPTALLLPADGRSFESPAPPPPAPGFCIVSCLALSATVL